jgi:hypothetical protein
LSPDTRLALGEMVRWQGGLMNLAQDYRYKTP